MERTKQTSHVPAVRCSLFAVDSRAQRGVTLLDTVVGVSLMLVVFLGIFAAFRLTVDVVTNNKARAGAIALADQRMEYIRSLSYASVGTMGGVPSGTLAQSESLTLNGISYTRRTVVVYADDPADGSGAADSNGITADYKAVKVDVAWTSRTGTRHVDLVTRVSPPTSAGETNPCSGSCGTLVINVVNSVSQPLAGASVTITNSSVSPAVNINTFTNAAGTVTLLAAPASTAYAVSATNPNYTSDSASSLSVTNNNTTSRTLQIDIASSMTLITDLYPTGASIGSVPFALTGITYGYNSTLGGSGSPTTTVSGLKWDSYRLSVNSSTGYDLAYTCQPQPIALSANTSTTTYLYLAPHSTNSLSVKVTAASNGSLLSGASVRLFKTGYDTTQTTDSCGQTYFGSLSAGTYTLTVSLSGYTTYTNSSLSISGATGATPSL
jgi:hypothetical protein